MEHPPRSSPAQDSSFLTLPVALFLGRALVVLLLALGQADLQLRASLLPVQLERHDRVAAPLGGTDQVVELMAVKQELARAHRISDLMRRGGTQWRQMGADQ